jgi:hypothetical protein
VYITIIVPLILCRYETWPLTLRGEHTLKVFEDRALRGIFGPGTGEVTGGWIKRRKGELQNLYSTPDIIRMIK